jgi:hypothetical protein
MNADKYIPELIFEHDCVIIPGFGGFIGNYFPALINKAHHTLYPPFKSLLFNINLKQNDGLLASYICRKEYISYDEALNFIELTVNRWNQDLRNGKPIEIREIGKLFKDKEGNLQFSQSHEVNYLNEAFGLGTIVSAAIRRNETHQVPGDEMSSVNKSLSARKRFLPNSLKWAAMLALPIGTAAFLTISNFEKIKSFSVSNTGILFPGSKGIPVKDHAANKVGSFNRPVPLPLKTIAPSKSEPVKSEVPASVVSAVKPYEIIVGAFKFKENAENLVSGLKQKGYDASIEGQTKTGLFRVSLQSHSDKKEAIRQLAQVRSNQFTGAWLLVK